MIAGVQRSRAERCLNRLLAQTGLDDLEIVVMDIWPEGKPLRGAGHPSVQYFHRPKLVFYSQAQAECVRQARGELIAFLEDHSYADPGWAAAIIEAFSQKQISLVTYSFRNHNPMNYVSRAFFFSEYGRWMSPAVRGPIRIPSCSNVAYRKEALAPYMDQLDELFEAEFLLHRRIMEAGGLAWLEPNAEVAHENWLYFSDGIRANCAMRRVNGARRVELGGWSKARRCFYACAMLVAPALHIWRLARSVWERPSLWGTFVTSLPVCIAVYAASSYAEALGYLLGPGTSREGFKTMEVSASRSSQ